MSIKSSFSVTFILFFVLGSVHPVKGQLSDWVWQNPLPQGNTLWKTHAVNSTLLWAVGAAGAIVKIENGIYTLSPQLTEYTLRDVHFTDANHGWAVGDNGVILQYLNGAWSDQTGIVGSGLSSVSFINNNEGWAAGDAGVILHYTNGTWSVSNSGTGNRINDIFMLNATDGWAVLDFATDVLRYDGTNWNAVTPDTSGTFGGIFFLDPDHGWFFGSNVVEYNSGQFSISPGSGSIIPSTGSLYMLSQTDGWAMTWNGTIYRFNGSQWTQHTVLGVPNHYPDLDMVSATDGWVIGANGKIVRYDGNAWNPQVGYGSEVSEIGDISMLNDSSGWASVVGADVKRYDGNSWTHIDLGASETFANAIQFLKEDLGWMSRDEDIYIYDGNNWTLDFNGSSNFPLQDICMVDSSYGYAVGRGQSIIEYSGGSWQSIGGGDGNKAVSVLAPNWAWCVTDGGEIYHDLGAGWALDTNIVTTALNDIEFLNTSSGWVGGALGKVFHFQNGQWLNKSMPSDDEIRDLLVINDQDIWSFGRPMIGLEASMWHYDGLQWTRHPSLTGSYLWNSDTTDSDRIWAVGNVGAIIHLDRDPPLSRPEYTEDIAAQVLTFPNPASDIVNFQYQIPRTSNVDLAVYDTQGRLVHQIIKARHAPGQHQISWDASEYARGTYIYVLKTSENEATGRVLLF